MSVTFFFASMVPESAKIYFYANPMAGLIESYRDIVMFNQPPLFNALLYATAFGIVFAGIGILWSNHIDGKILKRVSG
jgi:ABC-type polysaccharide/polyol phosphate export permease